MPNRSRALGCALALITLLGPTIAGCTGSADGGPASSGPAGASSASRASTRASATSATVKPAVAPTVIVLDASGSMLQADAPRRRIEAARAAVTGLVGSLPASSRVGVVVFGTTVSDADSQKAAGCRDITSLVPLGAPGRPDLVRSVAGVRAKGWTPLASSLDAAAALLPGSGAQNIVLLTDGVDTCSPAGPCPTARTLHAQRPDLHIDTVAFKAGTAAEKALTCVSTSTGGISVDAANTAQLLARIGATTDPTRVTTRLTTGGYQDLSIGMTVAQARRRHSDFPSVGAGGVVRVVYVDCDLTFTDGVLTEIAPRTDVPTLDGLGVGDDVSRAATLYGPATPTTAGGTTSAVFAADAATGTGYRIGFTPSGAATSLTGTITTIVLCRCRPVTPVRPGYGDWHSSTLVATTDSLGAARLDMTLSQLKAATGVSEFRLNPDYANVPVGTHGLAIGPPPEDGSSSDMTCFGAFQAPGGPTVRTDKGVTFGDSEAAIRSAYGSSATYVIGSGSQGSKVPGS